MTPLRTESTRLPGETERAYEERLKQLRRMGILTDKEVFPFETVDHVMSEDSAGKAPGAE